MSTITRRKFISQLAAGTALGVTATSFAISRQPFQRESFFEISLAEWSFHKALFANKMTNLDFPVVAKQQYGISNLEYVNQFFKDKATDTNYLNELLKRCNDNGVKNHLIMCDGEGELGDLGNTKRRKAVENHYKWVDAAKHLGCTTIRVNAAGKGSARDVQKAAIDGISHLAEYAAKENINVIVENHGGYSSNGQWLVAVMKGINRTNVGVLPDFNNFCIKREGNKCTEEYDRYKGITEMMPYAKGASAKTIDFDPNGNCVETDYYRMLKIIKDSGFHGYLGIEYEGEKLSEEEGVRKTKALLEKVAVGLS
jgi:sugar phosphate isomerase/epimerase